MSVIGISKHGTMISTITITIIPFLFIFYYFHKGNKNLKRYNQFLQEPQNFQTLLHRRNFLTTLYLSENFREKEKVIIETELEKYKKNFPLSADDIFLEKLFDLELGEKDVKSSEKYFVFTYKMRHLFQDIIFAGIGAFLFLSFFEKIFGNKSMYRNGEIGEIAGIYLILIVLLFLLFSLGRKNLFIKREEFFKNLFTKTQFFIKIQNLTKEYFVSQTKLSALGSKNILLYAKILEIFGKNITERQEHLKKGEFFRKKFYKIFYIFGNFPNSEKQFFLSEKQKLQDDARWVKKVIVYWTENEGKNSEKMVNNGIFIISSARQKLYQQSLENISKNREL